MMAWDDDRLVALLGEYRLYLRQSRTGDSWTLFDPSTRRSSVAYATRQDAIDAWTNRSIQWFAED